MCTAVLSLLPNRPVLLAGVRDELTDREWRPPGRHWPGYPDLTGGIDLQAGGTWLAVNPAARRVACVLNGIGQTAPANIRRSRGELPLRSAAGLPLDRDGLAGLDPFRLLVAEPGAAWLSCWDGRELAEHALGPGLHMIVNSALISRPAGRGQIRSRSATCRGPARRRRTGASTSGLGWPGSSIGSRMLIRRNRALDPAWPKPGVAGFRW